MSQSPTIAEQAGIPGPPDVADLGPERLRRKTAVIGGYRILSKFGLDEGISGHITAEIPKSRRHSGRRRSGDTLPRFSRTNCRMWRRMVRRYPAGPE